MKIAFFGTPDFTVRFLDYLTDLQESPQLADFVTNQGVEHYVNTRDVRHLAADNTIHIGNNSYHYVDQKYDKGYHIYFHKDHNGIPEEVNYIDKNNNQKLVSKRNGDSKINLFHMEHHIKTHGELKTDTLQSPGGKHLWIKFIKSKPKNINFESNGIHLDHTNIDEHEHSLWRIDNEHGSKIIRAYHVNPS